MDFLLEHVLDFKQGILFIKKKGFSTVMVLPANIRQMVPADETKYSIYESDD